MMGAISSDDGPKTKHLRAKMGDVITSLGHELLTPHVAYDTEQTTFRERVGGTKKGISLENERLMDLADIFIAEGTGASEGRGYEIAYALHKRNLPVIVMRHETSGDGSSMIIGNQSPLIFWSFYNEETMEKILIDLLEKSSRIMEDDSQLQNPAAQGIQT